MQQKDVFLDSIDFYFRPEGRIEYLPQLTPGTYICRIWIDNAPSTNPIIAKAAHNPNKTNATAFFKTFLK